MKRSKKGKLKSKAYNTFEFPAELVQLGTNLSVYSNAGACLQNYREVLVFTYSQIVVSSDIGRITFKGEKLNIESMDDVELIITGKLSAIIFEGEG